MKTKFRVALLFAFGLVGPLIPFSTTAQSMEDAVTQADAFVIGQHYGGGIIFWIDESGEHGLIAAEFDQGFNWWGDRHYFITGATGPGSRTRERLSRLRDVATRMQRSSVPTIEGVDLLIGFFHHKMNSFCFISRRT